MDIASPSLISDVLWFEGDEDTDFVMKRHFSMALDNPLPAQIHIIGVLTNVMAIVDSNEDPWTTLQGVIVRPDEADLTVFGMVSSASSVSQYWDLVVCNTDHLLQWHLGHVPLHSFFGALVQHGGIHVARKVHDPVSSVLPLRRTVLPTRILTL